ncbi:MAG: tryptophan--tRNA ligase [Polyangiaceae bacterium UTPRO1]|nr:tryptophan--tRNA ligase [Myxococcales bacterium]OQY68897.1 MAG: tryptophan--tRNA ligase [Polyangiaceae bacterium UTPRO1]
MTAPARIVSGMRPTGRLHLGHLLGTLRTWRELQAAHECFFFVADWHALTTDYDRSGGVAENVVEMVIDWLASGIDPERATIFVQSAIPEHAELHLLLSMITPLGWLERVPTYKEMQQQLTGRDLSTYGFLGYPVLQAADILMYRAAKVPVGADQVPHVELTREIARRFNHVFGEVFPEPQALLAAAPRIPGLDGRKMSKSYNNAVFLGEDAAAVNAKLSRMMTDPRRARRRDPGDPDDCPAYTLHRIYCTREELEYTAHGCRTATIGCLECKQIMIARAEAELGPIRERRHALAARPDDVRDVIVRGNRRAKAVAEETMATVRRVVGLGAPL